MRAIHVPELGGPEVLRLVEAEVPEPGPGEVTIDVAYTGVNFADLKARSSGYRVTSFPFAPGLEVSGSVRALGDGVTGLRVGQHVVAFMSGGGYAEVVTAPATTVFALPDGITLRTGAALPVVLPTAHALVHEVGGLREGQSVLVQGAAGGVGTAVGQLARAAGAGAVYGVVSSQAKASEALKFGYDEVFLTDDFADAVAKATEGRGVDLALDPVGGETFQQSFASLAAFGRIVSYGNASGAEPWQATQASLFPGARAVAALSVLTLAATHPQTLREVSERSFRKVVDGVVDLPITAEFPLEEAAEAHRLMETRTTTGKLLLKVAS